MANKDGVFIIGLDGATFDLLMPLMEAGIMPALASLVDSGAHCVLNSTIPPVTGPAWSSFQTGTNPGKHGVVDFQIHKLGSYQSELLNSTRIQMKTLWEVVSAYGLRVCAINVPVTYPPRPVNGCLISGFLTPSPEAGFTYPQDLRDELLRRFPGYVIAPQASAATLGVQRYVDVLVNVVQQRLAAALWLMDQEDWDLFMVHFQAVDLLQHAFWDHLDPRHPAYPTRSEADRQAARRFYEALDGALAKLIEATQGKALILMSDHGFGPGEKRVYLNRWLHDCGLLGLRAADRWLGLQAFAEDAIRRLDVLKLRHRLLPKDFKRGRGTLIRGLTQDPWIDWSATRAFMFSGSTYPNLFVNQAGREPQGAVAETAYEDVREVLSRSLKDLVDPVTGKPVIESVYRREEIYTGPAVTSLPDLVATQYGGYLFETRFKGSAVFGPLPPTITGLHRMEGVLMLSGDAFIARREALALDAGITDMAPTILHMLGVPVPVWMDGRVLSPLFSSTFEPPFRTPPDGYGSGPGEDGGAPAADAGEVDPNTSAVEERLRDLGYL